MHTHETCKYGWTKWYTVWGLTQVGQRNQLLDGVPDPPTGRGSFEEGHKCTAPTAGVWASPAHVVNECIHHHEGWQYGKGDLAFRQFTLDTFKVNYYSKCLKVSAKLAEKTTSKQQTYLSLQWVVQQSELEALLKYTNTTHNALNYAYSTTWQLQHCL